MFKCTFTIGYVEYLEHFITRDGISTYPFKIDVVSSWPLRKNLKKLCGFLGHVGYYCRFVKDFGKIAQPFTDILKKDNFHWSKLYTATLFTLKHVLIIALVLCLPNFSKKLVVETDPSSKGIKVVLM